MFFPTDLERTINRTKYMLFDKKHSHIDILEMVQKKYDYKTSEYYAALNRITSALEDTFKNKGINLYEEEKTILKSDSKHISIKITIGHESDLRRKHGLKIDHITYASLINLSSKDGTVGECRKDMVYIIKKVL